MALADRLHTPLFLFLTLQFLGAGLAYGFAPEASQAGFTALNELLGGAPRPMAPPDLVYRFLAAGNVLTLALCCGLLLRDRERYIGALYAFLGMKGFVAVAWIGAWVLDPAWRFLLLAGGFDALTAAVAAWVGLGALGPRRAG